jgi:hypothetical protein
MAARPILAILSLVLLAGGILLQFFIILSGTVHTTPINQVYFLEASTNGIPNVRNPTRWTYFALCGADSHDHNVHCGAPVPALPFSPPDDSNFDTTKGVPKDFVGTDYYFLMSRFAWVFYLMALVFASFGLLTGLVAMCSRIGGFLSGMVVICALFWQTLAAALMTAWVVNARDVWKSANQHTKIGVMAMAFTWTSVACFFLSTVLFCIGGATGRDRHSSSSGGRRFGIGRSRSKRSRSIDS